LNIPTSNLYIKIVSEKFRSLRDLLSRLSINLESKGVSDATIEEGSKKVNREIILVEGGLRKLLNLIVRNIEELEKTIRLLENQLARIEMDFAVGEIDEDRYNREKMALDTSINVLKERLESIKSTLNEMAPEVVREYEKALKVVAAERILSELPKERAFYFYVDYGKYTGRYARSLEEFSMLIREVDPESIRFHIVRKDFQRWIRDLGDEELADSLNKVRADELNDQELVNAVSKCVNERLKFLKSMLKQ